jgi:hypothetical protein
MTVLMVVNEDNKSDGRRVDASEKHCCLDLKEGKNMLKKKPRKGISLGFTSLSSTNKILKDRHVDTDHLFPQIQKIELEQTSTSK